MIANGVIGGNKFAEGIITDRYGNMDICYTGPNGPISQSVYGEGTIQALKGSTITVFWTSANSFDGSGGLSELLRATPGARGGLRVWEITDDFAIG